MNATPPLEKPLSISASATGSTMTSRTATMRWLLPVCAMPAEGDDEGWTISGDAAAGLSGRLAAMNRLVSPRAPRFTLGGGAVAVPADIEGASVLQCVQVDFSGSGADLIAAPGMTLVDWDAVAERAEAAMRGEHFIATPSEQVRVFVEEAKAELHESARGFAGEVVPLIAIHLDEAAGSASVAFFGAWMADPASLGAARDALPVRGLADSTLAVLDGCLLLNESEVEGRGLLEAVLSVSMLAMVFSDPGRTTPPPAPQPAIESVAQAQEILSVSEPLLVKSQKLRQTPPLVYPNVIKGAQGCEHKVIVDISAQRAFVFIDGQLAFETPVSSASKGRHTPRGTFRITEKIRTGKRSTIYKSLMPYWMRLDQSAIGMHTGQLPGYPASHGCVRMPDESARFLFDLVPKGTTVQIVDSLKPAPVVETIVAGR